MGAQDGGNGRGRPSRYDSIGEEGGDKRENGRRGRVVKAVGRAASVVKIGMVGCSCSISCERRQGGMRVR